MQNDFLDTKPYFLTCSLREKSIQENICCLKNAIYDGADAFMIHLEKLPDESINVANLKKIYDYAGDRLIFSVNYRSKHKPGKSDEEIVQQQLLSLEAGANVIDVFADIFSPSVNELAMDKDAIQKQKKYINFLHNKGAKVLMSSHIYRFMDTEEILAQAKEMESRGPDIVKIALSVNSEAEMTQTYITMARLRQELKCYFFLVTMGQYGKINRAIEGFLGSKIVLCVHEYNENSAPMEQPLLKAMKQVYGSVDTSLARDTSLGTIKS